MPILSYGEDALTLHALQGGLGGLLNTLADDTPPEQAIVFFRPSFGRRSSRPSGKRRSEFGEPDAIIGTPKGTYVVEAKWSSSSERRDKRIDLRVEQVRRHQVLEVYLQAWRGLTEKSWQSLISVVTPLLEKISPPLVPPRPDTTLARNLEFVLRELDHCGEVKRVLLFSRGSHQPDPGTLECADFAVVMYVCPNVRGSNFIDLSYASSSSTNADPNDSWTIVRD